MDIESDKSQKILTLKRRIIELNNRLKSPDNWSIGEIQIFRTQLKSAYNTLSEISKEDYYFNSREIL